MKIVYVLFLLIVLSNVKCGLRQRETQLEKRENEINQKEQKLLLLETQLQLKEAALAEREKKADSIQIALPVSDSALIDTTIIGDWSVNMRCTETTCEGSAVGDTKNETWSVTYQGNVLIAKAMADKQLVRIYTGTYTEAGLQLAAEQEQAAPSNRITVTLEQTRAGEMQGIREIRRPEECHIVYALTLKKI